MTRPANRKTPVNRRSTKAPSTTAPGTVAGPLIPIDARPIRDRARREYEKAVAQLESVRNELKRHEAHDGPQFARWLHSTFGSLLTDLRALQDKLEDKQHLLTEIEMRVLFSGMDPHDAYQDAIREREAPSNFTDNDFGSDPSGGDNDPFDAFGSHRPGPEDEPSRESKRRRAAPKPKPGKEPSRLKDLYRALVRLLHPDRHETQSPQRLEWWHQVQTAYQAGDADQLEIILTLCEIQNTGTTQHTSVSLLGRITSQLKKTLGSIKRQLTKLRRDPAWKFSLLDSKERSKLAARTRSALESEVESLREAVAYADLALARLSETKPPRRRSRGRRRSLDSDILDLFF